jgi:hypothetical protein
MIIGFSWQAFTHVLPLGLSLYEFHSSSIRISWYHFPFHMFLHLFYLIFLYEWDYATRIPIYMSFDWNDRPILSANVLILFLIAYYLCFLGFIKYQ